MRTTLAAVQDFQDTLEEKYTVLARFLTGSRGYGLHHEKSDWDWVFIVDTPDTIRYGVGGNWVNDHTQIGDHDFKIYTLQEMFKMVKKQTLNALELMYLPMVELFPAPYPWREPDRWVTSKVTDSIVGHAYSTLKHLTSDNPTTNRGEKRKAMIQELGYDSSRVAHSLRGLYIMDNLLDEKFHINLEPYQRDFVLQVKGGEFSKEDMVGYLADTIDSAESLLDDIREVRGVDFPLEDLNAEMIECGKYLENTYGRFYEDTPHP